MALKKPNTEDLRKIHAEVNQVLNQMFIINTAAITIFGTITAWIFPKEEIHVGAALGGIQIFGSILIMFLLLMLFVYSQYYLLSIVRTLTSYLVVTEASGWEADWIKFRDSKLPGCSELYLKAQGFIFLLLGIIAGFFPYLVALIYSLSVQGIGVYVQIACSIIYLVIVIGKGFYHWGYPEDNFKNKWTNIKNISE